MDLSTSCRPWPLECVLGLLLWILRSCLSFVCWPPFVCWPFPLFVCFCPWILFLLFPWVYLGPWGQLAWGGVAGGLVLWRMFVFVVSFVAVGHWAIGRPLNGSCWNLIELFNGAFQGFLFWCFLWFIPLSGNRVVGSGSL